MSTRSACRRPAGIRNAVGDHVASANDPGGPAAAREERIRDLVKKGMNEAQARNAEALAREEQDRTVRQDAQRAGAGAAAA